MCVQKTAGRAVTALLSLFLMISVCISPAMADTQGTATVTASALNMRSQASTASSIVTCLPRGTSVTVTGTSDGWYQVSYKGFSGYMSADYLSFSGSTASSGLGTGTVTGNQVRVRSGPSTNDTIITTVNKGTTMSVTGTSGSWYQVSCNGSTAYISSTYVTLSSGSSSSASSSSVTTEVSGTGTINGTCVRMRSGPSTGYSILGTFNTGTSMTVTGSSGDWYKVSYNGTEGYVYKTYLTVGSADSASEYSVTETESKTYTVTAAVNMRSGPSTDYTSLRVLGIGTTVTVTGISGKWSRVSYNGSTGYIFSTYLTEGEIATTSANAVTASGTYGDAIVNEAKRYLGVSYVYGGTSPSGFDCSGLVYYVYRQCGYSITRTATSQNSDGRYVSRSELQPGDIIIFYNSAMSAIGHAGIYIGDGQFIHASSASGKVVITSLSANYYNTHYYSARRVVS